MVKSCEDILIIQRMHNPLQKECREKDISLNLKLIERNNMLPLAGMLFNVVSGLVMDKAQNLAKDHVEKMIDDVLRKPSVFDRLTPSGDDTKSKKAITTTTPEKSDVFSRLQRKDGTPVSSPS